jgi:hypothetical protein
LIDCGLTNALVGKPTLRALIVPCPFGTRLRNPLVVGFSSSRIIVDDPFFVTGVTRDSKEESMLITIAPPRNPPTNTAMDAIRKNA